MEYLQCPRSITNLVDMPPNQVMIDGIGNKHFFATKFNAQVHRCLHMQLRTICYIFVFQPHP